MNTNFTKRLNNGEQKMSARSLAKYAALALAFGLAACAGDVGDVDRTQPNKVEKSIFTGEWYFRPVVTETQYNQGILFEGVEGDMDRVRWEIREHELIAYRSWELLEGAEEQGPSLDYHGAP